MSNTEFQDLLRRRRSIRKYTGAALEKQKVDLLIEALLRSPTSRNGRSWEFVLVDDRSVLERLSKCKPQGAAFLKDAALGIVIAGDSAKTDVWVEDASIAGILAQVAAESLGLGSCWIQIRNRSHDVDTSAEQYVQGLLGLPEHLKVVAIISVGQPAEEKPSLPTSDLPFAKVSRNRYSQRL
jgi:nitroreductase